MTLRVIEGFDYLPTDPPDSLLGAGGWSGSVSLMRARTVTAFDYGRSFSWDNNFAGNFNGVFKFLRGRWATGYVFGLRLNVPTAGIGREQGRDGVFVVAGADASATQLIQWALNFDQFGVITFVNYSSGTPSVFARTDPWAFVPGNWFYLEIKVTPGYTAGSIEVKVNTVPVLSLVSVRTSDGSAVFPATLPAISHLNIQYNPLNGTVVATNGDQWRNDDIYFLTMDGPRNNDYLGNVRVKYMPVVGNSTPLNWAIGGTSPAATNWQSVLNTDINDTRYVFASTPGDQDFYQIDPNLNTPTVYGVEVGGAYKQDDATQRFVANQIRSGSSTTLGASFATNSSYTIAYDIYELNPDTGLGWTGAELNAATIGPRVIT